MGWEFTIIFIAMYSVCIIPIKIGINKYVLGRYYDWIDLITYILYVLDLLFNFRTTYINNQGVEIRDLKLIRKKYLLSQRFILDFISLLNLPLMQYYVPSKVLRDVAMLCGLFKAFKI